MATYEEIYGKRVKDFDSDPTLDSSYEGQVWYDKSSGVLKSVVSIEATNSAPNMTTARSLYGFGVGTSAAGLTVGGIDDSTYLNACEEWNGSGWAAGGNYPTSRYSAGTAGTQTAAIAYCGRVPGSPGPGSPSETYNYDGSSWTSGNSFPTGGNSMQGIGAVNTAVVSTQDYTSTSMHHWNGTSWTSANARNTAKGGQAAFGTQTAAVLAGGFPSDSNITEVYDGTNWTSGNTMNTGRQQISGSGTQTDGLAFGGDRPPTEAAQTTIESWDGTSWATSPATLATARSRAGAGRNTASGTWIAGGIGPGGGGEAFEATEEYNKSINTITAAAWASGGNMPQRTNLAAASGSQTANIVYGGDTGPAWTTVSNQSVLYDGSSWTAGTNIPGAENNMGGTGTQTAGIYFGGYPNVTTTVEWDGSSFSGGGAMSTGREKPGHNIGIQTAAIACGGYIRGPDSSTNSTEEYNGSSWTAGGNLNTARYYTTGAGTETAGLCMNGINDPSSPPQLNAVEEYNGSSWTSVNSSPYSAGGGSSSGTQTAALLYGGNPSSPLTTTAGYDGTNWSTRPNMANATSGGTGGHAATSDAAIRSGGYNNTSGQTEEFTGVTETVTASTLTTS